MLFFLFKFTFKGIEKWIFLAFGKILVLANAFSIGIRIEKLIFLAFGHILVLVNSFFLFKFKIKVLKKSIFQCLARSWFW